MTVICEACGIVADPPVVLRGLEDHPGTAVVCWPCLGSVIRRGTLSPSAPTLREELEAIFEEEAHTDAPTKRGNEFADLRASSPQRARAREGGGTLGTPHKKAGADLEEFADITPTEPDLSAVTYPAHARPDPSADDPIRISHTGSAAFQAGPDVRISQGKRDQTCPCGITEAAGAYCTRCLRPTQGADLHPPRVSDASRRALAANRLTKSPRAGRETAA